MPTPESMDVPANSGAHSKASHRNLTFCWTALTRVATQLNASSARLVLGCSAEYAHARRDEASNMGEDAVVPNPRDYLWYSCLRAWEEEAWH